MARSYQFRLADGSAVALDDVDKALCEITEYPYSDKTFCPRLDNLVMIGFGVLFWAGRVDYGVGYGICAITRDLLFAYLESYDHDDLTPLVSQLIDYLAGGKYTFNAWG